MIWPGPVAPEASKVYPANKVPMEPPVLLAALVKKGTQVSPALKVTQVLKAIGVSPVPKATQVPKVIGGRRSREAGAPGIVDLNLDTDNDGYPDWIEATLGTDIQTGDSRPDDTDNNNADALQGAGHSWTSGTAGRDGGPLTDLFDENPNNWRPSCDSTRPWGRRQRLGHRL